jgi:hypothetical protein
MTNRHRAFVAYIIIGLLVVTNSLYVFSYIQGKQSEFSKSMDQPAIQLVNLIFLVVLVVCACIKPKVTEQ